HPGRSRIARLVIRRIHRLLICQTANRNRTNLNGRLGNASNSEHGTGRWSLPKVFSEDLIQLVILADVFEVDLRVDHVLEGQTRRSDDRLYIIECLSRLLGKSRRLTSVRTP